MAAGVIALVLQANPELTWRDVQHLIVETSSMEGLRLADWRTNGAGKQVSHSFGFGLLDAEAMIEKALHWSRVSEQVVCETETLSVNLHSISTYGSDLTTVYTSSGCNGKVKHLEHVQIWISFRATKRGNIQIDLTSPEGTRSRLLRVRPKDTSRRSIEWTFMTVHSWGEEPAGEWSLRIHTSSPFTDFTLTSWKMTMYGTGDETETETGQVNVAAIVGGVVGGVVLLVVIAIILYKQPWKNVTRVSPIAGQQIVNNQRIAHPMYM